MDQLPRLGKRELICLLLFTCNFVLSVWRGFLFLRVLGMGYVILLWHSLSLPLIILFSLQSLYYLNPIFQACSHRLWLYSSVFGGPGRKLRKQVFLRRGSFPDLLFCNEFFRSHGLLSGSLHLKFPPLLFFVP